MRISCNIQIFARLLKNYQLELIIEYMPEITPGLGEDIQMYHRRAKEVFGDVYEENKDFFNDLPKRTKLSNIMDYIDRVEEGMDFQMSVAGETREDVLRSSIDSLKRKSTE